MMIEPYTIFSIFIAGGLLLACGLMLLFAVVPASPLLSNYRKARYMMAGAYLFFVAVEIAKYLFQTSPQEVSDIALMQTVTLAIAASQAFLFTFAMLALLDVRFPGWRYIFREAALSLLFISVVFAVHAFCPAEIFKGAFYIFAVLYAILLVRYTLLFLKSYRLFRLRMDNYFSDMEAGRLRWVACSFFAAFAVGVMALLSSLFMSTLVALLFAVVFDIFYVYFAIRFINYAHQFQSIERAIYDETSAPVSVQMQRIASVPASVVRTRLIASVPVSNNETPASVETRLIASLPASDNEITGMHDDTFVLLEKRIELWVANKGFSESGITIDTLAALLYTNQKYLSSYINTYKKQTFRKWINELRIEEAKILLLQEPKTTLTEIFHRTGFSEKSHFLRQFKEQTGVSPTEWKNRVRTKNFPVLTPKQP
jgi:AraC-like DNA-binding protein